MSGTRQPAQVLPADARWVLIKGYHDTGGVQAAYGPYTEERARWLLDNFAGNSMHNWTLAELQKEED